MDKLALLGGQPLIQGAPEKELFGWPILTREDEEAALEVIRNNAYSGTDITEKFQTEFAEWQGCDYAVAFCNGTQSIAAAMFAIGLGMGDEIICPTKTYWASVTQASMFGATAVFCNVDENLSLDPDDLERCITKNTKAIKNVQNYISATDEDGKRFTLFTPMAPYETPDAIQTICDEYNRVIGEGKVDPLLIIPVFIHDFLCVHPFLDGNGRMSRLLTTLLLYRAGYEVGKYISLEAKIAKNKDAYYAALEDSQVGWHEQEDDPTSFIKYLLGTIIAAYRDFDERIKIVSPTSLETVKNAIDSKLGRFTKRDILELCPNLSASSVERHLKKLTAGGYIVKHGAGKNTFYAKN